MSARTARGVLVAVLIVAAMLLLLDMRGAGPGQTVRGFAGAVAGPPVRALAWVRIEAGARFGGARDEQARIAQLERELSQARAALGDSVSGQADSESAAALAHMLPVAGYRMVTSRVVARSTAQELTDAVTIAAGSSSGIAPGMVVIHTSGVVGLVAAVAPGLSTLRLVTDPASRLAARVARSREAGILQGADSEATLTLLEPLGGMAIGDQVVTIGTHDGLVPADLALGRITAIDGSAADLTRAATVDPHVAATTLDRIAVLVPQPQPQPQRLPQPQP